MGKKCIVAHSKFLLTMNFAIHTCDTCITIFQPPNTQKLGGLSMLSRSAPACAIVQALNGGSCLTWIMNLQLSRPVHSQEISFLWIFSWGNYTNLPWGFKLSSTPLVLENTSTSLKVYVIVTLTSPEDVVITLPEGVVIEMTPNSPKGRRV